MLCLKGIVMKRPIIILIYAIALFNSFIESAIIIKVGNAKQELVPNLASDSEYLKTMARFEKQIKQQQKESPHAPEDLEVDLGEALKDEILIDEQSLRLLITLWQEVFHHQAATITSKITPKQWIDIIHMVNFLQIPHFDAILAEIFPSPAFDYAIQASSFVSSFAASPIQKSSSFLMEKLLELPLQNYPLVQERLKERLISKCSDLHKTYVKKRSLQHDSFVISLAIATTPDTSCIVTGSLKGIIRIWNLENGDLKHIIKAHECCVVSVTPIITPEGSFIVSGSIGNDTIGIWNLKTGEQKNGAYHIKGMPSQVPIESVAVAKMPNGSYIVIHPTGEFNVVSWNLDLRSSTRMIGHFDTPIKCIATTSDSRYILIASGNQIALYNIETNKIERYFYINDTISFLAVTPDNSRVIIGMKDGAVTIENLKNEESRTLKEYDFNTISSLAVTPNGKYAIAGTADGTVIVWDLETEKQLHLLKSHTGNISSLAISKDSLHVISSSADHTAKIWDIETGRLEQTLTGHSDKVNKVVITHDNSHIITCSDDGKAIVWNSNLIKLSIEQLLTIAHTIQVKKVELAPAHYQKFIKELQNEVDNLLDVGKPTHAVTIGEREMQEQQQIQQISPPALVPTPAPAPQTRPRGWYDWLRGLLGSPSSSESTENE